MCFTRQVKPATYNMNEILRRVQDVDPNNSDLVKETVTAFFQHFPQYSEGISNHWVRGLENVINRFPKYCMSHRNTIEIFLVKSLDSQSYYNVIEAAKCGHALQQVRPSQEKTATPKTCWSEQVEHLCNAAHSLIGAIFLSDVYKTGGYFQKQETTIIANTPLSLALTNLTELSGSSAKHHNVEHIHEVLCTRLKNVLVFLQAMLVEVYPVAKPIRPQVILDVILRALASSSGSNESINVTQIADIKLQALRTMDALILCLGSNLIPFSMLVFRLVLQTLKWTSDNPSEETSNVRCACYNTLTSWLTVLHCHDPSTRESHGVSLEDRVTAALLEDITPRVKVVQLTVGGGHSTKNLSKKAKRKLANSMLQESSIASHMPGERNKVIDFTNEVSEDVVVAALECTESFLTVCGIFLKPTTHKVIQERLIRACRTAGPGAGCGNSTGTGTGVRYWRSVVRCTEAARRTAPPGASITHYCLDLYSRLISDGGQEISRICSSALLDIRLQLYAAPPTISYSPSTTTSHPSDKEKVVSERNRQALESLIGASKMPPTSVEEVITIPDEPANKKPRLSIEQQISVSSQSSVEVSDESEVETEPCEEIQETDIPQQREIILEIEDAQVEDKSDVTSQATSISLCREYSSDSADDSSLDSKAVHDAVTQLPGNVVCEDDVSPRSAEIAYDFPNTGNGDVKVLEKIDDDQLPSTNETDDVQITCGQTLKSSQDVSQRKGDDVDGREVRVNGIEKEIERPLTNGDVEVAESTIIVKVADNNEDVTVEEMMADFVDEVDDEALNVDA